MKISHRELDKLLTDRWWIIEEVGNGQTVMGFNDQALVAFTDRVRPVDDNLTPRDILIDDSDVQEVAAELEGRPVQDGNLTVDLDKEIGDAGRVKSRKKVLDGADVIASAGQGLLRSRFWATKSRWAGIWAPPGKVERWMPLSGGKGWITMPVRPPE